MNTSESASWRPISSSSGSETKLKRPRPIGPPKSTVRDEAAIFAWVRSPLWKKSNAEALLGGHTTPRLAKRCQTTRRYRWSIPSRTRLYSFWTVPQRWHRPRQVRLCRASTQPRRRTTIPNRRPPAHGEACLPLQTSDRPRPRSGTGSGRPLEQRDPAATSPARHN